MQLLGAAARAGFGSRGGTVLLSCMAAVAWHCPPRHPVPAELSWVPQPIQPCWIMLKPSAAVGPGLPRLRDLVDISHPASDRLHMWRGGSFWCLSLSWDVPSLRAGDWGDPTGFWMQEKPQQKAAGGVPEQGTQGPFSAVSPVVTLPSTPSSPGATAVLLPLSPGSELCPLSPASSVALCSLPPALAEVPVLVLGCDTIPCWPLEQSPLASCSPH